jgi:hypothetical protein
MVLPRIGRGLILRAGDSAQQPGPPRGAVLLPPCSGGGPVLGRAPPVGGGTILWLGAGRGERRIWSRLRAGDVDGGRAAEEPAQPVDGGRSGSARMRVVGADLMRFSSTATTRTTQELASAGGLLLWRGRGPDHVRPFLTRGRLGPGPGPGSTAGPGLTERGAWHGAAPGGVRWAGAPRRTPVRIFRKRGGLSLPRTGGGRAPSPDRAGRPVCPCGTVPDGAWLRLCRPEGAWPRRWLSRPENGTGLARTRRRGRPGNPARSPQAIGRTGPDRTGGATLRGRGRPRGRSRRLGGSAHRTRGPGRRLGGRPRGGRSARCGTGTLRRVLRKPPKINHAWIERWVSARGAGSRGRAAPGAVRQGGLAHRTWAGRTTAPGPKGISARGTGSGAFEGR